MTPVTPEDKELSMPLLASPLGGFMPLLIVFILLIGFTVWQGKKQVKKQQKERAQLESRLEVGARVVLNSGLFVTITHLGDKQAVVELAPGVEVSVLKQAIVRPAGDEEEFAFADDVAPENSTAHDEDVATDSASDALTSPEASAVAAHTSDEQPQT
ncbi:preprotein translocase, YajC subunit [Cutibacterium modestum HL037PA3]|uniref:preprotein translocase subunit YajC n=1 Tax=Cutibacterium modestum TaxID=2559073 RepID=UPI0001F09B80|nr:preprotein translocase subunit YajC [Cutibacterium modestum]EFT16520.1 preprotein translocase, YajC subunit [Cutibacterium modestum HL037PA3]